MHFSIFRKELIGILVITVIFGTVYGVAQQVLRQDANDPQIQLAEDIATVLAVSNQPSAFESSAKVDVAKSLAPFLVITDADGKATASTGQLDNQVPSIPAGVLSSARKSGQDRVTWQPKKGVRIALVVQSYNSGYVAVGRSLREVETRSSGVLKITAFAWVFVLFLYCIGIRFKYSRQ